MNNYRLTPLRDTKENRERILANTRKKLQGSQKKPRQNWKPVIIGTFALLVAIFLGAPYIQQAFMDKDYTIEKVVFPEEAYDSLFRSTYIDETNEFIYNTANGFYSFDVSSKKETLIVDTSEAGMVYDYAVSEDWLVWAQPVENNEKIHVFNRERKNVKILEDDYFYGIELKGDILIYMGFENEQPYYFKHNLQNSRREPLLAINGGGSSRNAIEGNLIAIPENNKDTAETVVKVIDFVKGELVGSYVFPYTNVQSLTLKDNRIYGYSWDDETPGFIGEIEMNTGKHQQLKTNVGIDGYATDGENFAISVRKGDSNSVQLFKREGKELKRHSKLSTISERLVERMFTEQGTLVLNGEGKDKAMYLIRFK